jgi:hypothetical protein
MLVLCEMWSEWCDHLKWVVTSFDMSLYLFHLLVGDVTDDIQDKAHMCKFQLSAVPLLAYDLSENSSSGDRVRDGQTERRIYWYMDKAQKYRSFDVGCAPGWNLDVSIEASTCSLTHWHKILFLRYL